MVKSYYKVNTYKSRRGIGYLLKRAGKLANLRIEELFTGDEEISFTQWVVLMNLRDKLHITAGEIAQYMCHDSGALTRVIDQLEDRKLLKRTRSKTDRRVIELELTQEGRSLTDHYLPRLVSLYNKVFEDFSREEADQAVDLLARLITKLDTLGKED
jgi:DNA-binding MarR family transcriptional regulator